jgi:hypothetical protein
MVTDARSPAILQIVRERLKPSSEAAYRSIEEETARLAAALGCPHPYLGAQSLNNVQQVWWFNGYDSAAEQQQVADAYATNTRLMAALRQNSERKAQLTRAPTEVLAMYRPDLTIGAPWILGRGRFLVIAVAKSDERIAGTVFEAPDGTKFIVNAAHTQQEAEAARAHTAAESHVLAVRPSWSFPAKEWIAADPEFWRPTPIAKGVSERSPRT